MTILILGAQCLEIYKAKSDRNKNKNRQLEWEILNTLVLIIVRASRQKGKPTV